LAVEARGVVKRLGGRMVLRGVSLSVPRGSVTVLAGPNGAGKTTLVRVILGLYQRDAGTVRVLGVDPLEGGWGLYRRVGYLPEDAQPYERLTGWENILFYARLYSGGSPGEAERLARRGAELSGLGEALGRRAGTYSKGMKRRLLLAASLMHDPELVVLDEPTSGLDVFSAHRVRGIVRGVAEAGATVLITTHNLLEAQLVADRVAFIVGGRVVFEGSVGEALEAFNASNLEEAFIAAAGGGD